LAIVEGQRKLVAPERAAAELYDRGENLVRDDGEAQAQLDEELHRFVAEERARAQ
jgi:hypothetical protein